MTTRILLGIDDSADALAATRAAIALARATGARVRAVHVQHNGDLDVALEKASGNPGAGDRRVRSMQGLLARIEHLAAEAGVALEVDSRHGHVGPGVLAAATEWGADLVVVGKSARSAQGEPYVGPHTRHILEFATAPVLVVPAGPAHGTRSA